MYQQPPPQPLNNNKNNNALSYYPQNSVSPPPLQHPIPTHPPIQPWSRLVIRSQQNGQMEGYMPPREDINSPDLYIPAMAFVTYVLLTGIVAGTEDKFHPEVLGINATTGLLLVIFELLFIKIGCYLLNITSEAHLLDFLSYSGYKFIGVIITLVVSLITPLWFVIGTFFYAAFANGFFLLRSLRYVVFPDSTNTVQVPQRKRRIHFLFVVSALQVLLMYYLIHKKQ
ncbi:6979_t:CDS:2 [Entrophospora sp. SA101]|nr:6979_t:CDS:2 [Entrophospora sp. SA101]